MVSNWLASDKKDPFEITSPICFHQHENVSKVVKYNLINEQVALKI